MALVGAFTNPLIDRGLDRSLQLTMAKKQNYQGWSKRIEANLVACYNRANAYDRAEGYQWYRNAQEDAAVLAEAYGVTTTQVCGVIAALSPGCEWGRNMRDAKTLIEAYKDGKRGGELPAVGSYGFRNIVKSEKILDGIDPMEVLGGDKVRAFYTCLTNPNSSTSVCVDRHAKGAAIMAHGEEETKVNNSAEYEYIAKHYRKIAERYEIYPNQFQATVWVVWRRLQGDLARQDNEEVVEG